MYQGYILRRNNVCDIGSRRDVLQTNEEANMDSDSSGFDFDNTLQNSHHYLQGSKYKTLLCVSIDERHKLVKIFKYLYYTLMQYMFYKKSLRTELCNRCIYTDLCEQCGTTFWKNHYPEPCKIQQLCCGSTIDLPILKENNVLKNLQSGGSALITSQDTFVFQIPPDMKHMPIEWWQGDDMIWLNT